MIKCTECDKAAAVNLGDYPFCLACAHAWIDEVAVYNAARAHEAEQRLAERRAINNWKTRPAAQVAVAAAM